MRHPAGSVMNRSAQVRLRIVEDGRDAVAGAVREAEVRAESTWSYRIAVAAQLVQDDAPVAGDADRVGRVAEVGEA